MDILDFIASDNYIPYNRTLAKKFGVENAIVFGALCGYQRYYGKQEFFREQAELMNDTCLTEYSIRKSIKDLKDLNLISVSKKGLPAKYYYKINTNRLVEILTTSGDEIATTSGIEICTTGGCKNNTTNNKTNNKKENIIINNNIKETEQKTKRFVPPTLQEVADYCKERGNNIDPVEFMAHYTATNWYRGKTKISNWRACVITWEKNARAKQQQQQQIKKGQPSSTDYLDYAN